MDLLKEWELENLKKEEVVKIINRFLDWDILPLHYFNSLYLDPVILSSEYKKNNFSKMLSFYIDSIDCQIEARQIWRLLSRSWRTETLKEIIMQDMRAESISEELKSIFWSLYNPIMDDLILNHLNDDWEFNF